MSWRRDQIIGSGAIVTLGIVATAATLLSVGWHVGWDATWRAFGVTPLRPSFYDMHVINDYAACAAKGADAYVPASCNPVNFNIPPTWLWVGFLGIDGTDSAWLSVIQIAVTSTVVVQLLRGRPWPYGLIASGAVLSPSVMMGVERGNLDLSILALAGAAALIYDERSIARSGGALAVLSLGIALKLIPIFCIAIATRVSKHTIIFACTLALISLIYLSLTIEYVLLIRRNVPTTFVLSYGYKTIFLGLDHIRSEAGLSATELSETWLPALGAALVLICAAGIAAGAFRLRLECCFICTSVAGTAFLFGAGIYCGTYLLGTNFIYRLMFLVLCIPQLLDWQIAARESKNGGLTEMTLLILILGVLWLNGNAQGHSIFLLLPQILNWLLFFALGTVLMFNLLRRLLR